MLQRNTPKEYADRVPIICDIVRSNQEWLQLSIDLRDKVNHFKGGGVPYQYFRVSKEQRDQDEVVLVPMWSDVQTVRDALGTVWRRLLCFCEEFVGFTLYLRLKPYWGVKYQRVEDEGESLQDEEAEDPRWDFDLDLEGLRREGPRN